MQRAFLGQILGSISIPTAFFKRLKKLPSPALGSKTLPWLCFRVSMKSTIFLGVKTCPKVLMSKLFKKPSKNFS